MKSLTSLSFCFHQSQDPFDVEQRVLDASVVRPVHVGRRRAGKRVRHTARRWQRARAHRRGVGQNAFAAQKTVVGRFFPGRCPGPIFRPNVPQAPSRHPNNVLLDTLAQNFPRGMPCWFYHNFSKITFVGKLHSLDILLVDNHI